MKIDGRAIAQKLFESLKKDITRLKKKGIEPHLVIILVGDDPASISYVNQKKLKGEGIGCKVTVLNYEAGINLPAGKAGNQELFTKIQELNKDLTVHGIIVQRPVPQQINSNELDLAIDPKKDVDGFHPDSKFEPPIAEAVLEILKSLDIKLADKNITVIGKGQTGGGPIIQTLKRMGIKPTVIDSKTLNSKFIIQNSDIIISAVGKPNIISSEDLKQEAILISLGMHKEEDGKLHGDYDEKEIEQKAGFYTPTPGGVGPVNVACLLKNLIEAAKN